MTLTSLSFSGTAAQQAAVKAHTVGCARLKPDDIPVICVHPTSHLVFLDCLRDSESQIRMFQEKALENLPGFDVKPFGEMSRVPTYEDVEAAVMEHTPDVVVLELPQRMNGGGVISLEYLRNVSKLCKEKGVKLHCDGARLFEVQPYYDISAEEIGSLFDSVYLSFYKGIGGDSHMSSLRLTLTLP